MPIAGRVMDGMTNKAVPFASVYINASTRGTTADAEGHYQLPGVPSGTVEIVASAVGYETVRQTMRLGDIKNRRITFMLKPDAIGLKAVTVTAKRSAAYNRMLKQFKRELLGENSFADKCLITNIETVGLTVNDGHLEATAAEPLVIENNALGYRLVYQLFHFDSFRGATYYGGASRFEAMKPTNNEQAERWARNRQRAYLGSGRHLLASLLAGTYEQEGFLVFEANFDIPADQSIPIARFGKEPPTKAVVPDSLFTATELPAERYFYSRKPLEVFYTRQRAVTPYRDLPYAYSLIDMPKGQAIVTTEGWVVQPNGMEMRGALSADRLATLLPADWQPIAKNAGTLAATPPNQGVVLPADALIDSLAANWTAAQKNMASALFLHTDKPVYVTGDPIWFSGFVLDPATLLPADQAVTDEEVPLHVDLIAPDGRVVSHQWVRVSAGRASGSFRLSDSLATGSYRLRAYTEADRNNKRPAFERNLSIIKGLTLGNDIIRPSRLRPDSSRVDVQFLPEGGRWVAGLPSRLGIKAIDQRGRGLSVSGLIRSQSGAAISRFVTNSVGIGSIELVPQANQTYTAQVRWETDSAVMTLPVVEANGLLLATDMVTDSTRLSIRIRASAPLATQPVYLTIQSRGQLVQKTKLQLQNGQAVVAVSAAKLPVGVAQITLFDALGHPQAERLVFIPERFLPIVADITTDKPTYKPRESVTLSVRVADGFKEQLALIGSVVVTDAQQVPDDSVEATIRTHLLLTSELRGRVELANEYLSSNQMDVRQALDNLLLTQGWRRVNGQSLADKQPAVNPAVAGLVLKGQVFDKKDRPVPDANLLLTFSGVPNNSFARTAHTDQQGRFSLDKILLADTATVQIRAMTAAFKPIPNTRVVLDAPGIQFATTESGTTSSGTSISRTSGPGTLPDLTDLRPFIMRMQQRQASDPDQYRSQEARQLKEVVVKANLPDSRTQDQQISRYGTITQTVLFDKDARAYENAYEMMLGRIPGVLVRKRLAGNTVEPSGGYTVTVNGAGSPGRAAAPQYLIDGVLIPENDEGTALLMLNLTNIERIGVIKNGGGGGMIAFFSATEKAGQAKPVDKTDPELTVYGFQADRQFYTPRYAGQPDSATYRPDWRDVLCWKPVIATSQTGSFTVTFPLSDSARTIRLRLQGVTIYGRPVSISRLINVR